MLLTGFFVLMRLAFPDNKSIHDWQKVTKHSSVQVTNKPYGFQLPHHKAYHYFKGNQIIVMVEQYHHNPLEHFKNYLASHDTLFPVSSHADRTASGEGTGAKG